MRECPCGSGLSFEECCGPILGGERKAATAEALMRSRYTAYATADVEHLRRSIHPRARRDFDERAVRAWSEESEWLGFEVLSSTGGGEGDDEGEVEFVARYERDGEEEIHREISRFERERGEWFFVEGRILGPETYVRPEPKTGRNDPCPCGSGKKYKKCCGR